MKNFKALHGCSLWLGKRFSNQTGYAIIVHDKHSALFSEASIKGSDADEQRV